MVAMIADVELMNHFASVVCLFKIDSLVQLFTLTIVSFIESLQVYLVSTQSMGRCSFNLFS